MKKNQKLSFTKLREELEALPNDELRSTLGGWCSKHPTQCPLSETYGGTYTLDDMAYNAQTNGYNVSGGDIEFILCGSAPSGVATSWDHISDFDVILNQIFGTPYVHIEEPEPYQPQDAYFDFMFDPVNTWDMTPHGITFQGFTSSGAYQFYNEETQKTTTVPGDDILKYQLDLYLTKEWGRAAGLYP